LFCSNCGSKNKTDANYCASCGLSFNLNKSNSHNINGNGNLYFGQNNTIFSDHISVNYGSQNTKLAYIERDKILPIKIGSMPITNTMTIFVGFIGFIGSIASIWSTWGKDLNLFYFFIFLVPFLMLGLVLTKQRFIRFLFSWNIESNKKGELFLTKIKGSCPKCDGMLKLKEVGEKNNQRTIVQCDRNHKHYWEFDFTIFGDIRS